MNQFYVIGDPIDHSLSPIMFNSAFKKLGVENQYRYDALQLKKRDLVDFIDKIRRGTIKGASVTAPYKEEITRYVDELSRETALIKAANTLVHENGKVIAYNTDGIGCIKSLIESGISLKNKSVMLLGAGGAAKAIAVSLLSYDIKNLFIINRSKQRASILASYLENSFQKSILADDLKHIDTYIHDSQLLIHATSIGMKGLYEKKLPIDPKYLHSDLIVFDIVYLPKKTKLLKEAEKRGLRTIEGWNMLLYQGIEQFQLFTGKKAPVKVMRDALKRELE